MKEFRRKKLAFALACASILNGGTQAKNKNEIQSQQTLAAVGGAATKNSSKGVIDWVKNHKLGVGIGGALVAATAVTLTVLGVKYLGKKDSGGNPNKKPDIQKINSPKIEVDYEKKNNNNNPNKINIDDKKKDEVNGFENKEKVKNLDLIKNKISSIEVEDKNQNDKDIIILAFEYFGDILAKNSLEELNDLFDHITNYNKHEGADSTDINEFKNKTYKTHVEESEEILLKIFGNNSEISNVAPNFVFRQGCVPELDIEFNFNGKKQKIEVCRRDNEKVVEIEHFYNYGFDNEGVVFKIPYDKFLVTNIEIN